MRARACLRRAASANWRRACAPTPPHGPPCRGLLRAARLGHRPDPPRVARLYRAGLRRPYRPRPHRLALRGRRALRARELPRFAARLPRRGARPRTRAAARHRYARPHARFHARGGCCRARDNASRNPRGARSTAVRDRSRLVAASRCLRTAGRHRDSRRHARRTHRARDRTGAHGLLGVRYPSFVHGHLPLPRPCPLR